MESHPTKRSEPQIIKNNDISIVDDDVFTINNIGNKRFIAIIGMFRRKYLDALYGGDKDGAEQIVKIIIDGIRNKAVPNGCFFEYDERGGWKDIGNGELAHQKVRISLLDNISRIKGNSIIPSLSFTTPNKSFAKREKTISTDSRSDDQNGNESINLGDDRFAVKDPYLLDNMSNLTRRRIITDKIRRNHNKKAVIKDDYNNYSSLCKASKIAVERNAKELTPKGTKKRTSAKKNIPEKISRDRDKNIFQLDPHQKVQFKPVPDDKINFIDGKTKSILTVKKTSEQMETHEEVNSVQPNAHDRGELSLPFNDKTNHIDSKSKINLIANHEKTESHYFTK